MTVADTAALVAFAGTDEELSDAELRDVAERAWERLSSIIDEMIGSGRLFDRELLIDLARFLENMMPAVRAYESLVGRIRDAALAEAGAPA